MAKDIIVQANVPLKELDGTDVLVASKNNEVLTLGKALGNILAYSQRKADIMKSYTLGMKFYEQDQVAIDSSDLEFIKEDLKTTTVYAPIVTGQILSKLSEAKPAEEPKEEAKTE